jgi:nucleoside-diphosphate-sugar epimerase
VTIAALADELGQLLRRPDLIRRGAVPDRPGDPPRVVADISRLQDEVGFVARWQLSDGLADTVSWWRGQAG